MDKVFIDYRPLMVRNRESEELRMTGLENQIPWVDVFGDEEKFILPPKFVISEDTLYDLKVNMAMAEGLDVWSDDVFDFDSPFDLERFEEQREVD